MVIIKLCCVPRRCGLCRFRFVKGETIIAVKQSGELSEAFDWESPMDLGGDASYIICYSASARECYHPNRAVGCHPDCLKLLPAKSAWEFTRAICYNFEPQKATEESRRAMLQYRLADNLKISSYLPPELRLKTAQHLIHLYAAGLAAALPFSNRPSSSRVVVSKEIWASTIELEGTKYLASLTNRRDSDESMALNANPKVNAVYICEDQWGIREVVFGNGKEPPLVVDSPDMWWKTLSMSDSQAWLDVRTDGVKVHNIIRVDGNARIASNNVIPWAIPQPAVLKLRMHKFCQDFNAHIPLPRMALFRYNDPKVTGYSVCCSPAPVAIHAHVAGEEHVPLYEPASESSVWIYMPLDSSEFVSEIWMRTGGTSDITAAFVVKTNRERTCLMGTRMPPGPSHAMWTLLERSDGKPGRFFLDTHDRGIRILAFESLEEPEWDEDEPLLPGTISLFPQHKRRDGHFYSSASLDGVESVAVCRRVVQMQPSIIGLLIRYLDGHTETLGQVRLDCLEQPVPIKDSEGFSLGFGPTESDRRHVKDITFGISSSDEEHEWFDVAWDGTLEWWFSSHDCQVCYKGRKSRV